jgi:hypothetical protein
MKPQSLLVEEQDRFCGWYICQLDWFADFMPKFISQVKHGFKELVKS